MTQKLFYAEPSLDRVEARVVDVSDLPGGTGLILDRTVFYPEGGGQPCDLGSVSGNLLHSVFLDGESGEIVHRLGQDAAFARGDTVILELDRARREDHRSQHSAQHLLSAVLERGWDVHTRSFHLGEKYSTIDVSAESMDPGTLEAVSAAVGSHIAKGARILTHLCRPGEAERYPLRKKPPEGEEELRIVEIEGLDFSPCAGTHVDDVAELGAFLIVQAEKYKGMTRLHFAAGQRAIAELGLSRRAAQGVAKAFGCSISEIEERARALGERASRVEAALRDLQADRAALEVELRISRSPEGEECLAFEFTDRGADAALETAKACAAAGRSCVAVSVPDRTLCVQVAGQRAEWGQAGIGAILKARLGEFSGSGGGGKANFRAVFPDAESAMRMAAVAKSVIKPGG